MAEEKKVAEAKTVSEIKPAEDKQKEKAVKKEAVKKTTAKKAGSVKTTAKTKATPASKPSKAVKTEKSVRSSKKDEPSLDNVTTVLWKKFKDINVSGINTTIAIQIIVYDLGTFFIAIKEDGEKHIIQAVYNDRDGTLEASYDEILKIAKGGYNYLNAIINGNINYQGDLKKALTLAGLFN